MVGYCSSESQSLFNRRDWPAVIDTKRCPLNLPSPEAYNSFQQFSLLPEKSDPTYSYFLWNLEKDKFVCSLSLCNCFNLVFRYVPLV